MVLFLVLQDEAIDATVYSAAEAIWPPTDMDRNPGPAVAALMKLSFDDYSRQPICALGKLLTQRIAHHVLCIAHYALHTMHCILCIALIALHTPYLTVHSTP